MSSENKKLDNEFDIFISNSVYPDATHIFAYSPKSLNTIKDDCIIIIDTNALLVPYSIGKEGLEQIKKTYKKLVSEKRLFLPGQVAREFARNRANKLAELSQQLNSKRNSPQSLQKGKYPLLESLPEYQESVRIEQQIDELLKQYRKLLGNVLDHVHNWNWNDPVSLIYSELFSQDVVYDFKYDKDYIRNDLKRRQIHKLPPGYKDSGKDDDGIGDLLIWHTILEIGKKHSKSVIFVSGEEKSDWWHKIDKQTLYPRYELVDEFRRNSDEQSFHIIPFSQFLSLYGASDNTVEEVREEESRLSIEFTLIGEFIHKWQILEQSLILKYRLADPVAPDEWRIRLIIRKLFHLHLLDKDVVANIEELQMIRNAFVHDTSITEVRSEAEIKNEISRLNKIIDIVNQISIDD